MPPFCVNIQPFLIGYVAENFDVSPLVLRVLFGISQINNTPTPRVQSNYLLPLRPIIEMNLFSAYIHLTFSQSYALFSVT